jgi:hypothetical protein
MRKEEVSPRFGPEHWVTIRDSGEHVKVEVWSAIAAAYRVRSRKRGVLFVTDDELDELPVHPDVDRGRHWNRCQAARCGAPLTPDLAICARCHAPTCTCGRCHCPPVRAAARAKVARKKPALAAK